MSDIKPTAPAFQPVAEIIAIGSELLTPQRVDTNSLFITEHLNNLGLEVVGKQIVGDDRARLEQGIREALARSEFVLLSGGLGPTEDDVTRDAAAAALGRRLEYSVEQEAVLIRRFEQIKRRMAENNRRQAYLIEGAEALPNLRAAQHLNQIGRNANPKVVAPAGQSGEEKRDNTPNR